MVEVGASWLTSVASLALLIDGRESRFHGIGLEQGQEDRAARLPDGEELVEPLRRFGGVDCDIDRDIAEVGYCAGHAEQAAGICGAASCGANVVDLYAELRSIGVADDHAGAAGQRAEKVGSGDLRQVGATDG